MRHVAQFKDLVAALILSLREDYDGKRNYAASVRLYDEWLRKGQDDLEAKGYDLDALYAHPDVQLVVMEDGRRLLADPILQIAMHKLLTSPTESPLAFPAAYVAVAERLRDLAHEMYVEGGLTLEALADLLPESADLMPEGWELLLHPYSVWHMAYAQRKEELGPGSVPLLDHMRVLVDEYKNRRRLFADLAMAGALKRHDLLRDARTMTKEESTRFRVPRVGGLFEGESWWKRLFS